MPISTGSDEGEDPALFDGMADIEQTLREWQFQGGPGRGDRFAGQRPRIYAALRASLLAVPFGVVALLGLRLDSPWVAVVPVVVMLVVAAVAFRSTLDAGRRTQRALHRWQGNQQQKELPLSD